MEKKDEHHLDHEHGRREQEARLLTIEQAKHLLKVAQDSPLRTLITVALTTGLRRGELLGLRWQDIDMQDEVLYVRQIVTWRGVQGATETSRVIALPRIVLTMLKEQQRDQEQAREKAGNAWHNLDLVFPSEVGQHADSGRLWQHCHALFVAAGFPQTRFHDLRRSAAALLLMMGATPAVIQAILGFRHTSTTISILEPVSLSRQREVMKLWDAFLEQ